MKTESSERTTCSCLSDDANIVDYSEAEQILQDIKADLKSIQNDIKTDLEQNCCPPGKTARACKVSSVLVKLQSCDSRLLQITNLMQADQPRDFDDLESNFGMSVKLDMARNKLNGLKTKHGELKREWHSQDQHLNKIAGDVAKKESELKNQSVFCTTQGYVLSKMLWKSSKCDCLLDLMVSEEKLILELIKTLDGCLYAFSKTFQKEIMPEPTADEHQYVLCLCGVFSNLASIPDGRFFLISQPVCQAVYDQIIKILPKILVPKGEDLKWIMLVALYNIMICKEGREYAKNNRYLLQSLSECVRPPHSNKIIILALKIIGNLTNDSNKAYMAHVNSMLPIERLEELQQSKDSCTIRKQAKHILSQYFSSMAPEELLHTIQLEQSKSRCPSACTQTYNIRKIPDVLAYYVFTDTTNTRTSGYTSSVSTTSISESGSEDRSEYDPSISAKSDFGVSESFLYPKFTQKPHASSAPVPFHDREPMETAYNARQSNNLSAPILPLPFAISYVEDPSCCMSPLPTTRIYMEDPSGSLLPSSSRSTYRDSSQEPMSGLSFTSSYSVKELGRTQGPVSTITPISTYVDSILLSALSSTSRRVRPSSCQPPYGTREFVDTSAPVSTGTPMSTYADSRMLSVLTSSSNRGKTKQLSEFASLPSSCGTRQFEDTSAPVSTVTPIPTYVDSKMLSGFSSSNRGTANQLSSSYPPSYGSREFENTSAPISHTLPMSTNVDSSMLPTVFSPSSNRMRSNFQVNVRFNEHPSTLCHPSIWSMPVQPINTFQEPTLSRSGEMQNLQSRPPNLDINKLLAVTIGDHLQNPSLNRRNVGNNTFPDGQSNPSIVTVFRINKSKSLLSPHDSSGQFCNTISTNTSFPWGIAMEDFFRINNKNIGTSPKSSRRHVSTDPLNPTNTELFDIAYGGYESYYEKLKKESKMPKPENVEKSHQEFDYEDINMPSTSKGYYGYETLNPFATYPDRNASISSMVEQKQESSLPVTSQKDGGATPQGKLGKLITESKKSETCSTTQSFWECSSRKGRSKPKKKPFFRIFDFGRKKKR